MMDAVDEVLPHVRDETPQMLTLGRRDDDLELSREDEKEEKPSWFLSHFTKTKNSNENKNSPTSRRYHELRQQQQQDEVNHAEDMAYTALGGELQSHDEDSTILEETMNSFFFRPTDVSPRRHQNHLWKTVRRNNRHSELFEYKDAVEVLPAPELQSFSNHYEFLNREIEINSRRHQEDDEQEDSRRLRRHDLELQVDDQLSMISHSNLVYEMDGKKLMRLPRDNVRLLMDPDLRAGVLSVEASSVPSKKDLNYVLTIDENLYRNIVKEMAPFSWVTNEKVDIRVAYYLLLVILLILLINTFAVREA